MNYKIKMLAVAVGCVTAISAAQAQQSNTQSSEWLVEEILVTATKRAQSVQDVPIAITAITAGDIIASGSQSMQDVASLVPNFEFPTSRGPGEADIAFRGISSNIPFFSPGFDSGFGVYLDGVYLGRQDAANADLGEVERLEVLRGPQGTLFGKNTIAGAVNIVTKKPSEEFEGNLKADLGNYDYRRARAMVNVPLIENTLSARFSATTASRGGYVTNLFNNDDDYGSYDKWGARANIAYTPSDTSRFYLSFDASDYEDKRYILENLENAGAEVSSDDKKYTIYLNGVDEAGTSGFGTSLTYEQDFANGYTLTSLTGFRDNSADSVWDDDLRPVVGFDRVDSMDQTQFTQELRIASPADGQFDYVAGLYYFDYENDYDYEAYVGVDWFGLPGSVLFDHHLESESYAAFVHSNYRFNDQWSMYAGARYTDETKSFSKSATGIEPAFGYISGILGNIEGQYPDLEDINNENVSWTAGLKFAASDDLMLYAGIATGFKSGGFNVAVEKLSELDTNLTVDPEETTSYELGMKSSWMDNRLVANVSLFYIDYTDLQVQSWDPTLGTGGLSIWSNAAKVESKGLELETVFHATENLKISAALGYTDATYKDFTGVALPRGNDSFGDDNDGVIDAKTDASGNRVPIAPELNLTVVADHRYLLDGGKALVTRIEYTHKGDRYSDQGSANTPDDLLPSFNMMNLRLGYRPGNADWSIDLWVRNLTDTQKAEESRYFNFVGKRLAKRYMEPRTYGLSVNYDF